jgi:beta-glucanase (GH16 family)
MTAYRSIAALAFAVLLPAMAHAQEPWKLVWSDEFDGDRLDESKWTYAADCGGGGNDERQCYVVSPQTVSVKEGVLRLTAIKRRTRGAANPWAGPTGPMKTGDYASGKILTKGKASWRFGRIEARARVPGGQGVWPAIWMMPERGAYGGWPKSGEIDILETVNLGAPCGDLRGRARKPGVRHDPLRGRPQRAHKQVRANTPIALPGVGRRLPRLCGRMVGRGDHLVRRRPALCQAKAGRLEASTERERAAPFDQPFHLILNLAFGGRWPEGANAKGVDEAALPATMEVDWVRVSQRP